MIFAAKLLLALANSWHFDESSQFQPMLMVTATLELLSLGFRKTVFLLFTRNKGMNTTFSETAADRAKERKKFFDRIQHGINPTRYGAVLTTPEGDYTS